VKQHYFALIDVMGACERIKKTPIPFSYSVYIKIFVSLYGLILPFGLFNDFGFYAIPLTMFIFFAMLGLELMAEEIEEPFGLDCNDLPTGDIALTIKKNVFEILEQESIKETKPAELYTKVF
jgi:putative membrane protein